MGLYLCFVDIRHIKSSHYPFDPISINYSNIIKVSLHSFDSNSMQLLKRTPWSAREESERGKKVQKQFERHYLHGTLWKLRAHQTKCGKWWFVFRLAVSSINKLLQKSICWGRNWYFNSRTGLQSDFSDNWGNCEAPRARAAVGSNFET